MVAKKLEKNKLCFINDFDFHADQIPDMVFLSGFVGDSSLEGYTRLYLNVVLSEYYEIPSNAVLHFQHLPAAASPFGVTGLWIKKDAELIRKGLSTIETKAKFFSGDIQQNHVVPPAAPALGPTGVLNCTQAPETCGNTSWPGCPPENAAPDEKKA